MANARPKSPAGVTDRTRGETGDDPSPEGIVPLEDDATGFLPVIDGDESYDALRLPHERDESVDVPPQPLRRSRRSKKTPR